MKTKLYALMAVLFAVAAGAQAQIVLQDPVISDSYMAFTGENKANNYRFVLDTYEWKDRGPQFQLTIEPLDAAQPAQFTTSDLSDPNYWEPMFRTYTQKLAPQEMAVQDNLKRLYVKNVAILPKQFYDYTELKIISIEADGDYTIPDGCFSENTHLETFDSNVKGNLTLGYYIVNPKLGFNVKVYTKQGADAWNNYRSNSSAQFMVDDSGVVQTAVRQDVNGDGVVDSQDVLEIYLYMQEH